jgi:hypothetical protein
MTMLLVGLEERHPGLTAEVAANYAQAARVCLDRHHLPPLQIAVESGTRKGAVEIHWSTTSEAERIAWGNTDDATRDGAYAVTLAVVEQQENLVAVGRAWGRTGADYFIAPRGTPRGDFEKATRLEVSGVDKGDGRVVRGRLQQKMDQARRGESDRPAMAAVIGFRAATVLYEQVALE